MIGRPVQFPYYQFDYRKSPASSYPAHRVALLNCLVRMPPSDVARFLLKFGSPVRALHRVRHLPRATA